MLINRAFAQHIRIPRLVQQMHMVQTRRAAQRAAMAAEKHTAVAVADLEFDGIRNLRDLSEEFGQMKSGCIFRTAAPIDASPADTKLLYNDLGIKDLIDLRSSEEVGLQGSSHAFDGISFCRYKRDRAVKRVVPDASSYVPGSKHDDILWVQIAVMEKERYYWSLVSRMRKRLVVQLVATALVDKPASRRIAIEEVNKGGLEGLYRVLLQDSADYFVAALRHLKTSVAAGRPVLFFCKAGKDRTGLLSMLLLSVLGASEEQILLDYERSDAFHMVALAGLEGNPSATGLDREKFERAPRQAMQAAMRFIQDYAGSVEQYLVQSGFSLNEQQELMDLLLLTARNVAAAPSGSSGSML